MFSGLHSGATVQSICGKTECQSSCSHRTGTGTGSCAHTLGAAVAHAVAPHSSGPSSCPGCESRPCPWSLLPIQGSGLGRPRTCWPRSLGMVSKSHAGGPLSVPVSNQREVLQGLQEGSRCGKLPSPQAPQQCWPLHLPGCMGRLRKLLAGLRCLVILERGGSTGRHSVAGASFRRPTARRVVLLSWLPGCLCSLLVVFL